MYEFDPSRYYSMNDIKRINKNTGHFFFEKDTLRFFRSRVSDSVYQGPGGVFFVTSEQNHGFGGNYPRLYSVRTFNPLTGDCESVVNDAGEKMFQAYESSSGAHRQAEKLSKAPTTLEGALSKLVLACALPRYTYRTPPKKYSPRELLQIRANNGSV